MTKWRWRSIESRRFECKNECQESQESREAGLWRCWRRFLKRSRCPVCVEDRGVDGKHRIEFWLKRTGKERLRSFHLTSISCYKKMQTLFFFPNLICRHIRYDQSVLFCYVWKRILVYSISFLADFIKVLIFEVSFWKTKTKRARNHFKMWGLNYESLRKRFLRILLMKIIWLTNVHKWLYEKWNDTAEHSRSQ